MYHSIVFDDGYGGRYHTWESWKLVPQTRPLVNPPDPVYDYEKVKHGPRIDFSSLLTGEVDYDSRKGSWEFMVTDRRRSWSEIYHGILNALHGRQLTVILEDEPGYYYTGRVSVNAWKSNPDFSTLVLDYDLEPYRYSTGADGSRDWMWNDLFNLTIYYGTFAVDGEKARTLINPGRVPVTPAVTCTSAMSVEINGTTYQLPSGETDDPGFVLAPGDTYAMFRGNGTVTLDYTWDARDL